MRVFRTSLFLGPVYLLFLTPSNTSLLPVTLAREYIGEKPLAFAFWFTVVAHALESVYTASLCRAHSTPFLVTVHTVPFLRGVEGTYVTPTVAVYRRDATLGAPHLEYDAPDDPERSYRFCHEGRVALAISLVEYRTHTQVLRGISSPEYQAP